ncbi:flagellar hook-basal body protein [Planctomycetota bacterium]
MSEISTRISSKLTDLTRELNIVTHNLANTGTAGYKRRSNAFSKALDAQIGAGDSSKQNSQTAAKTIFDFSQGNLVETGRAMDFALCGKGFFVIETPQGPLYTRNGMFRADQNGRIVDSIGRAVAGDAGPISIPADVSLEQVTVSKDGSVSANGTQIGKLKLVDFKDNENQLIAAGTNCFSASKDIKPLEAENIEIKQGFREGSNVKMVEELVDMVMITRLYEANMKFVSVNKETSKNLLSVAMG